MTQASKQYRFGRFMLNPQARQLFEDGRLVALAPKILDVLLWLFEHRGRAVGRDELGAAIWGKADFTDGQLDQLIWGLRRALGDSERTVIRTVPRFGYLWAAEVEPAMPPVDTDTALAAGGAAAVDEDPAAAPETEAARIPAAASTPRRLPRFALGAFALLAVAAGAWGLHSRYRATPPDSTATRPAAPATAGLVAVLPVVMDVESDSRLAWLRLGLMDLIAARLIEGGAHVVPAQNIVALMGGPGEALPDAEKIREVTGATIVIAPSIHRGIDGWRLRLDLGGLEGALTIEVHETEPTATARQAADRVLVLMNRTPVAGRPGEERADEDAAALLIDAAVASERFDVAQRLLDEVPPALRRAPRVRFMGVHVLLAQGRTAEALAELEALAGSDADLAEDAGLRSSILQALGAVLVRSGRPPAQALKPLDDAVEAASKAQSAGDYGSALQSRAALNVLLERWPEADADFAQARVTMEMIGDSLGLAELDANEAGALIKRQRYAEATTLQDRAIERLERFPVGEALRIAYGNQIALELDLLDTPAALETATKALKTLEKTTDLRAASWLAMQVSRADIAAGRLGDAERRLIAVRAALDPAVPEDRYSNVQLLLAQLALARGDAAEAARLAASAAERRPMPAATAAHFAKVRSAAALLHVRALLELRKPVESNAALQAFAEWAEPSNQPDVIAHLRLAQALVSAREDSSEVAAGRFDAALDAGAKAAPASLAKVAVAYGTHLLDAHELGPATRVIGRVARWAEQDYDCALLQARLYHMLGQPEPWRRALTAARRLAGERAIPPALAAAPAPAPARGTGVPVSGAPPAH